MVGHKRGGDCSLVCRLGYDFADGARTGVCVYPNLHGFKPFSPDLLSDPSSCSQILVLRSVIDADLRHQD